MQSDARAIGVAAKLRITGVQKPLSTRRTELQNNCSVSISAVRVYLYQCRHESERGVRRRVYVEVSRSIAVLNRAKGQCCELSDSSIDTLHHGARLAEGPVATEG